MSIVEALAEASLEIGAVKKLERNTGQGFQFRGIDAVTKACHPVLGRLGIVVVPAVQSVEYTEVLVGGKRTPMVSCRMVLQVQFIKGAEAVTTVVACEAMDSGDKATAKAHSVGLRTALLQTLMLPTDEPDPDHHSYQRSEPVDPEQEAGRLTALVESATTLEELRALWPDITHLPDSFREPLQALVLAARQDLEASE